MSTMASGQPLQESSAAAEKAVALPAKKSRARPYVILGAIVAVAGTVYVGYGVASRGKEGTDDAQVDADVVAVSARVAGTVLKLHVSDNQAVKKGQLLLELDPADLTAKEKQAEAELAAARARAQAADARVAIVEATSRGGLSAARAELSGASASVASADARIASARAALAGAQAEAAQADTELARGEALLKDQAIPQAQVDAARSRADAAHAAVARAQAQLSVEEGQKLTAQTGVAQSRAHIEQSAPIDAQLASARASADLEHASLDAAAAALDLAKLQLSYTRIEAPVDGVLSRLSARQGQLVQGGQPVVVVVPSTTYVVANFKETQVGKMHVGQRAEITVDAFGGRSFEGTVESTSPGTGARFSMLPPDNASGNFVKVVQRVPVKIAWVNVPADVQLAAGMSADVTVITR